MKTASLVAALSPLVGGVASAADIPPAPAYPPVAIVIRPTWTGCYFGVNAGGIWVRNDSTFDQPVFPGSPAFGTSLGGHDASGWLYGIQIGCSYQAGNWVFGAQGGFDWSDAKGSHPDPIFAPLVDRSRTRQLMEMTWRIGYAFGRFLPYVKVGGGWERIDYTMFPVTTSRGRETGGWTIGVGGEYAITDWLSAFLEYRYLDFGTTTQSFVDDSGRFIGNVGIHDTKNLVKAGLNFRYGG